MLATLSPAIFGCSVMLRFASTFVKFLSKEGYVMSRMCTDLTLTVGRGSNKAAALASTRAMPSLSRLVSLIALKNSTTRVTCTSYCFPRAISASLISLASLWACVSLR